MWCRPIVALVIASSLACGGGQSVQAPDASAEAEAAPPVDCMTACESLRVDCGGNGLGNCPDYCANDATLHACIAGVPVKASDPETCARGLCCGCPTNPSCGMTYEACVKSAGF